jgi:hypothetical protein
LFILGGWGGHFNAFVRVRSKEDTQEAQKEENNGKEILKTDEKLDSQLPIIFLMSSTCFSLFPLKLLEMLFQNGD